MSTYTEAGPWIMQMNDEELAKEAMQYVMADADILPLPVAAEILKRFAKSATETRPSLFNDFTIGLAAGSFAQSYKILGDTEGGKNFLLGFRHFEK